MKLIEFSTRRRVTVTMFVTAAVIFGMVAFQRLAINLLPDITYPTLTVRTEYEGTAPSEMERLITEPVEGAVGVVTNVIRVSSISRPGVSPGALPPQHPALRVHFRPVSDLPPP